MQPPRKDDPETGANGDPARKHGEYAEDDAAGAKPRPREKGDYEDPGKSVTGAGNASKGPWKEQGGAGHGENYGARDKERSGGPGEGGGDGA